MFWSKRKKTKVESSDDVLHLCSIHRCLKSTWLITKAPLSITTWASSVEALARSMGSRAEKKFSGSHFLRPNQVSFYHYHRNGGPLVDRHLFLVNIVA